MMKTAWGVCYRRQSGGIQTCRQFHAGFLRIAFDAENRLGGSLWFPLSCERIQVL